MRGTRDVNLQSGTSLLLLQLRCLWEELDRRVEEGARGSCTLASQDHCQLQLQQNSQQSRAEQSLAC